MKVIDDSHDAVFMKPLSRVTAPVWARSLEMSIPRSPSVPTIMGSSVSSLPMRSTAGASLISWLLLVRKQRTRRRGSHFRSAALAYGGPVAVAERDLTSGATRGFVGLFPWRGVVAPWLVSRVLSIVVLLAAVNDPARGSRFVQVATRWDGAFYLDIARNGYGPVERAVPEVAVLPAAARVSSGR